MENMHLLKGVPQNGVGFHYYCSENYKIKEYE